MIPNNPVGKLIANVMKKKGISRPNLVRYMGYKNINKGLRRFDACMAGENYNSDFMFKLIRFLDINKLQLVTALNELEKSKYIPRIVIIHKPIITSYMFNPFRNIELKPEIRNLSFDEQVKQVSKIIKKHGIFGDSKVIRYVYKPMPDKYIKFDKNGLLTIELNIFKSGDFEI